MAKKIDADGDLITISQLLRHLVAIELWRGGLSQSEIGEKLGMAAGSVNKMLKGVRRELFLMAKEKE